MKFTISAQLEANEICTLDKYLNDVDNVAQGIDGATSNAQTMLSAFAEHAEIDESTGTATVMHTVEIPEEKVVAYVSLCNMLLPAVAEVLKTAMSPEASVLIATIHK